MFTHAGIRKDTEMKLITVLCNSFFWLRLFSYGGRVSVNLIGGHPFPFEHVVDQGEVTSALSRVAEDVYICGHRESYGNETHYCA